MGKQKSRGGRPRERSDKRRWITLPPETITVVNRRTGSPICDVEQAVYDKDEAGNFYLMKPAEQGDEQPPWTMYDALYIFVFQQEGWEKPLRRKRIMRRVLDAFELADGGDVVDILEDDWREVKDHIEDDDWVCPEPYGSQLLDFFDAFCDAPDRDPRIPVNGHDTDEESTEEEQPTTTA